MSRQRVMPGGWAEPASLRRTGEGEVLCRWCDLPVPAKRRTFCSSYCVHEWKLRSDPGYLREQVLARDKGRCSACGLDCIAEWNRLRRMPQMKRALAFQQWGIGPRSRKSLWDADHSTPVSEGGGECDLSNMRTLCLKCHRDATAALRVRRALTSSPLLPQST